MVVVVLVVVRGYMSLGGIGALAALGGGSNSISNISPTVRCATDQPLGVGALGVIQETCTTTPIF